MEYFVMTKQRFIDFTYVKEHADFEQLLAHYGVKIASRTDGQLRVHCPFHDDRKPSCGIDTAKNRFNCFAGSCDAKGNILEFVARMESSDLRTAAETLAGICDIALAPPKTPVRAEKRPMEKAPSQATGKAASEKPKAAPRAAETPPEPVNPPLTFELKLDPAHPYLAERGITPAIAATFGLGYANRGMMKGRLCIPIRNQAHDLVAYAGRWALGDETIPEGEDRYKLPPAFQKSRVLYNLERVRDFDHLVVIEGYFGVFRLHADGVPAVALMGSSIADEQIALLRRLEALRTITLLLDGDAAGRKARLSILPRLSPFWRVHAPELPEGAQPDTVPEAKLRELLAWPT